MRPDVIQILKLEYFKLLEREDYPNTPNITALLDVLERDIKASAEEKK